MNWCSPCLTFHLMFAGCTVVRSSALPCVLPGPSGAARRSPHHPWDQEPCCAAPPVCPGPVGSTITVWHYDICLQNMNLVLKPRCYTHLHTSPLHQHQQHAYLCCENHIVQILLWCGGWSGLCCRFFHKGELLYAPSNTSSF